MQNFLTIPHKDLDKAHAPIFFNGKSLYKDACVLVEINKSYASATSLFVLSTEEYIKSILVLLEVNGYEIFKNSKAKKFFKDHKIRHNIAQLIELILFFYDAKLEITTKYKKRKAYQSKISWILETIIIVLKSIEGVKTNEDRVLFLSKFNDLKNNGLYVGYRNQLQLPSKVISKSDCDSAKEINERISKFYKLLRIFFHSKIDRHIDSSILNIYQKGLKKEVSKLLIETELIDLKSEMPTKL